MGSKLPNNGILCNYATPNNDTTVELHMSLPIAHSDMQKLQGWLENNDWAKTEQYLANKYPEHSELLAMWCKASRERSLSATIRPAVAA
jgi:hypothetical protein